MSRTSKGFADFFPTAPSVLQQKRSKASQDRRRHFSPTATQTHPSFSRLAPPASSDEDVVRTNSMTGYLNDGLSRFPNSSKHEDGDCVSGDAIHEVASASSTSTASSIFSAGPKEGNTLYRNGPQMSTSLTPLTNIDSSPRTNGMNASPKRPAHEIIHDTHLSSTNLPRSPSTSQISDPSSLGPEFTPSSIELRARPGHGEIKGFKAIYDPDLDKALRGKEKKVRQVQYRSFGEEVCLISIVNYQTFGFAFWA